jgi:hypothetical protein
MKTKLEKVFFIYSNASVSVLMYFGALVEFVCWFFLRGEGGLGGLVSHLAFYASIAFFTIASSLALSVYKDAKKSGII